ncbi:spore wall maturation protein DIT1 [Selaginella moellendorffii]|nr:spore wall maturation protein DIT1 [Selaginella moellendorffii]XP_002975630.2 spore wall maturation protein DIT1 [Selaginella moellendorffii]|eukprot:XP_002975629.2 spore wall maturation protein DIT1 [Selaginella moellendorffii]
MASSYPKDKIAFLYIHRESGEIGFVSQSASRHVPVLAAKCDFLFSSMVASDKAEDLEAAKQATRSVAPEMNKYTISMLGAAADQEWTATVYERYIGNGFEGVVFIQDPNLQEEDGESMSYLASLLLDNGVMTRDCLLEPSSSHTPQEVDDITSQVVDIIEKNYIHFPKHDQWFTSGGKQRFADKVRYHVARNIPLEFVLPAFPVKSCNPDKTLGKCPDKAEELAIHSMKIVADLIKAVYAPGVHYNVASDGHVFSDLVGSDDAAVDSYGEMFWEMAHNLYPGLVNFFRLDEFLLDNHSDKDIAKLISNTTVEHPVATELTANAENARRALMCLFGCDESTVTKEIKEDPETRNLYRGFSRFMLEDLYEHKSCKNLPSKSAKKKLCSQVAFLMILRNRAYSAMVEWLFPLQLRISIHPHPNRGPKYGINIIHSSLVAAQRSSEEKNFHIPTPWHNAVVELADGKFMLLHSKVIRGSSMQATEMACEQLELSQQLVLKRQGYRMTLVTYPDGRPSHYRQVSVC